MEDEGTQSLAVASIMDISLASLPCLLLPVWCWESAPIRCFEWLRHFSDATKFPLVLHCFLYVCCLCLMSSTRERGSPNLLHLVVTDTASAKWLSDQPGQNLHSATVPTAPAEGRAPGAPAFEEGGLGCKSSFGAEHRPSFHRWERGREQPCYCTQSHWGPTWIFIT